MHPYFLPPFVYDEDLFTHHKPNVIVRTARKARSLFTRAPKAPQTTAVVPETLNIDDFTLAA